MTMRRARHGSAVLAAALLLTACGSGSSGTGGEAGVLTSDDLDRTAYVSTHVDGHDLVPGTHLRLTFQDGRLGASTGCNSISGPYSVTGGRLSWTEGPAMTEMGCAPERMDQDQWLVGLLTGGVDATLDGDALTLTTGDVTIRLRPEPPA
jgi:heat shock protein HslJ